MHLNRIPLAPKSSRAARSRLAHPRTISTLRETAQPRTSPAPPGAKAPAPPSRPLGAVRGLCVRRTRVINPQSPHKSTHNPPTILPTSRRGWGSGLPFGNAPNPMPLRSSSWRFVSVWLWGSLSGMPHDPDRLFASLPALHRSATHNHTRSHPLSTAHQPTATAHRPTEPRTSTHSLCTSTHRATHGASTCRPRVLAPLHPAAHKATHILAQATAHVPRSRSALCHPAMLPYKRASQPLGALPPCNAPHRGASSRRRRVMGAYGIRAAAGAESAVAASSVVVESAALLAVTTSWLLVASWFPPSAPSSLLAPPTFLPPTRTAPHSPPYGRRLGRDAPPPCPCKATLLLPPTGRAS